MNHDTSCCGSRDDQSDLLAPITAIGPILQARADANDDLDGLNAETFDALKPLRMSQIFAPKAWDGAQMSPTRGLELIAAITYQSGSAGWVSMVPASIGAMSAAFLPDTAVPRLFAAAGTDKRFSGLGPRPAW